MIEAASPFAPAEPGLAGQTVGARLRAARTAAGLSLTDIAQSTRVNARHLDAIERDDHTQLPAPPYSVGFVKAFARAVGIDPAEAGAEFRREWDALGHPAPKPVQYEPADPARVPSRALAWTAALIAVVLIAGYALWRSGTFGAFDAERRALIAAGTDQPAAPPVAPAAAPVPAAPTAGPVLLTATEAAWIKVYERDGPTLFQGELAQGQSYEVPATAADPLIRLGRAESIKVSVGGRDTAPLGPAGRTVKDVSLKAQALLDRPTAPATVAG